MGGKRGGKRARKPVEPFAGAVPVRFFRAIFRAAPARSLYMCVFARGALVAEAVVRSSDLLRH